MQTAELKALEGMARSEARLFFDGCDRIQMSLAIFRSDITTEINQNLAIVN